MAMQEPHPWIICDKARHHIASRWDKPGISTHWHGIIFQSLARCIEPVVIAYQVLGRMAMNMDRMRAAVIVVYNKLDHRPVMKNEGVGIDAVDLWEYCVYSGTEGSVESWYFLLQVCNVVESGSRRLSARRSVGWLSYLCSPILVVLAPKRDVQNNSLSWWAEGLLAVQGYQCKIVDLLWVRNDPWRRKGC